MVTREQGLRRWFSEWQNLKAWRRSLSEVTLEISDRVHPRRLGTCWTLEQRIVIYGHDADMPGELNTLIHEMAHAAEIEDHHGVKWQECYSRAILEITKTAIPRVAANYEILNRAGKAAVRAWWKSSGNDMIWKMVRG